MAIKLEWDPEKTAANRAKHKVSFEQARDAFQEALDEPDDRAGYGEVRFNLIGAAENRLLIVTYTLRSDDANGDEIIRIISARPTERREARKYREGWSARRSAEGGEGARLDRIRCVDQFGDPQSRPQRP